MDVTVVMWCSVHTRTVRATVRCTNRYLQGLCTVISLRVVVTSSRWRHAEVIVLTASSATVNDWALTHYRPICQDSNWFNLASLVCPVREQDSWPKHGTYRQKRDRRKSYINEDTISISNQPPRSTQPSIPSG